MSTDNGPSKLGRDPLAAGCWQPGSDDGTRVDQDLLNDAKIIASSYGGASGGSKETADFNPEDPIRPGQLVFEKFETIQLLGKGGMGQVWLVLNTKLGRKRALKFILPRFARDPISRGRFLNEAKTLSKLVHPNVVDVFDFAADPDSAGAYIEMEYVPGKSLDKLIQPDQPMPLDWTARILYQLCDALQAAHDNLIVHRDLKPHNLMLLEGGSPGREDLKVIDFGIAKVLLPPGEGGLGTMTQGFLGSYSYASPEQIKEERIDARSDIYSVGVILFELLTGHRPFKSKQPMLQLEIMGSPPPRFAEVNPDLRLPPAVEQIVLRCLEKEPADRFGSARELKDSFLSLGVARGSGSGLVPGSNLDDSLNGLMESGYQGVLRRTDSFPGARSTAGPTPGTASTADGPISPPVFPDTESEPREPPPIPGTSPSRGAPNDRISLGDSFEVAQPFEREAIQGPEMRAPRRSSRQTALVGLGLVAVLVGLGAVGWSRRDLLGPTAVARADQDRENIQVPISPSTRVPPPPPPRRSLNVLYEAAPGAQLIKGWPSMLIRRRDGVRFVLIEGGSLIMGAFNDSCPFEEEEKPGHVRRLSSFYIQESEVTYDEIETYLLEHPDLADSWRSRDYLDLYDTIVRSHLGDEDAVRKYPAVGLTRRFAMIYAESVGGKLPTEGQFEFAARSGGLPRCWVWGPAVPGADCDCGDDSLVAGRAHFYGSQGLDRLIPHKVNLTPEQRREYDIFAGDITEQGVMDLAGNVRELCRDAWRCYPSRRIEKIDWCESGLEGDVDPEYVVRGGSFLSVPEFGRTTDRREPLKMDETANDVGFRVVLEIDPQD